MVQDSSSAHAVTRELGERIRMARLRANVTQKQLAERAGLSLKAVTNSEKGKSTLESIVAILMALGLTEQLDLFIPKQQISPLQLATFQGRERKRAKGDKKSEDSHEVLSSW